MAKRYTVMVVTGSRAEYGLLRPVMRGVQARKDLRLCVVAAGSHLLGPGRTVREVEAEFEVAARVTMQKPTHATRHDDACVVGRGVEGFAKVIAKLKPQWVVVLGDRIEAFAAAAAGSIAGVAVCHVHGGDRAEGIADEAMRHAITKLAHLHCAATKQSAARIVKMGERQELVHVTGSPAIDGLTAIPAMGDEEASALGDPGSVVLVHPSGVSAELDEATAASALTLAWAAAPYPLVLSPNHDAGRESILKVFDRRDMGAGFMQRVEHLPRNVFVSLLKRLAKRGGVLIGNSSAGLIEAAALGVRVVNLGPRQVGRERAGNVIDVPEVTGKALARVAERLLSERGRMVKSKLYGDGHAGERIAALLAKMDPTARAVLRKRNAY